MIVLLKKQDTVKHDCQLPFSILLPSSNIDNNSITYDLAYPNYTVIIGGLQPIPSDPKRQWHGGHVGRQNKRFCHPTWLRHHCLLDL